jgi:ribonuclease Z
LTIFYPRGSPGVEAIRAWVAQAYAGVDFGVVWAPIGAGDVGTLAKGRSIEAFAVQHAAHEACLGYRVVETRRRLKAAFAGLPRQDIERLAREGRRGEMTEEARHVVFAHTGDAMPIDATAVRRADLLVHDATFLDAGDRRELIHATTGEALAVAREAAVSRLLLYHLSIRYDRGAAIPALRRQVADSGFGGACWLLDEASLIAIGPEEQPSR